MRSTLALGSLFVALTFFAPAAEDAQGVGDEAGGHPFVLSVQLEDEALTPVTARFVESAIRRAEREGATCLVLTLDTPGGLVDSTRAVVKAFLRSSVPIVVYVPPGGRAASAGVFLTLASHVAAMGPGSNIGAAHPVQIGGLPISPPSVPSEPSREPDEDGSEGREGESGPRAPGSPLEEKIVNDTMAWARALSEMRGRNSEWAARAVKESLSATAEEAVREGIVDLLASDVDELLREIDGREVTLPRPRGAVVLRTAGAPIRKVEMWWGDQVLAALCHPNLAFVLLILGFYGILFEFYTPGWGVAGVLGTISIVLAFFALAVLPIDYVGLVLILLALGMFVAEAFVTSYGALALGGTICLSLGGLMLVDSPEGFLRVSTGLVLPMAAATAVITLFLIGSIVRAHRSRVTTGGEGLVGGVAVATEDFSALGEVYSGRVLTHGENWRAESETPVTEGQDLEVLEREGLVLHVRVREESSDPDSPFATGAPPRKE